MSEKFLSEAEWKKFAKSGSYKDTALLKALAALDKAERSAPTEQLKALDELDKQAEALLKIGKGDKALASYLDDLGKSAKKQRKAVEAAARDAEQAEAEGEDEASPALLTTKMLSLVREIGKGDTTMSAMIALAGKEVAVLIMRQPISPARRKLLSEFLKASGNVKYLSGECLQEAKALTFVVEGQAAGLAKRLKAALFAQTGLRLNVRVRGEDGAEDEEGETGDEQQGNEAASAPASPAASPVAATPATDVKAALYEKRLEALMPALRRGLSAGDASSSKLRAVIEFAQGKAEAGNAAAALQALDALEKLLAATSAAQAAPTADSTAPPAGTHGADAGEPEGLEAWEKARADSIAELKEVAKIIAAGRHADANGALIEINAVIKQLTARPTTAQQVAELDRYLNQDDVVAEVCEFVFDLRTPLLGALDKLKAGLEATA